MAVPGAARRKGLVLAAVLAVVLAHACGGEGPPHPSMPGDFVLDSASFAVTGGADPEGVEIYLAEHRRDTVWARLTRSPGLDASPRWSPDGRFLFFHAQGAVGGQPDLDIHRLEPGSGAPVLNLTASPGFDYLPDVSPDGRRVAFLSRRPEPGAPDGSPGHIYLMDADGRNPRRVTRTPVSASLGPRWMPDGRSLLFARRVEAEGPTEVVRISIPATTPAGTGPVGGREVRLIRDGRFNYTPVPAPDGLRLAYTAETPGAARVILVDARGENPVALTETGYFYVQEWTPDGRWIVVDRWNPALQRTDAWLVSPDRSVEPRPLLDPVHRPSASVAFRPGTGGGA